MDPNYLDGIDDLPPPIRISQSNIIPVAESSEGLVNESYHYEEQINCLKEQGFTTGEN